MYMKVRRAAKINTGNYENTDMSIELEDHIRDTETVLEAFKRLCEEADVCLKTKIDDIELGARKEKSKAHRFGC